MTSDILVYFHSNSYNDDDKMINIINQIKG